MRSFCSSLPARTRGACRRRQAEALQRQWLSRLAWGPQPEQAAEIQLWLNGPANHRRNPNENLARELLELFSLGEGHYSETDVREACSIRTAASWRPFHPGSPGADGGMTGITSPRT